MMLWKCYPQYDSKFGKLSSGHRTGKGQLSFQSQRKKRKESENEVAQSCPNLCDPRDCSLPGSYVHGIFQARIHRRTVQKNLHDPDNRDGVITHTHDGPDILECEVKWALGSITTNKARGGDGIPAELFQILKMMLWKCCTQYASKFGKLSSGHRTGKGPFSFQSQRKAMSKNAQTTAQLHSSHSLVK